MDLQRHAGKVAVVTGAAGGIGRAVAARLAREGATVVGCNVSPRSRSEAQAYFDQQQLDVRLVPADVSVQADVDALVEAAGPRIDLLAGVAGAMDNYLPLGDLDDDTWQRVVDVNLTGTMRVCRAVLPIMLAGGGGAMVAVGSRASLGAGPAGLAYATTKHGLLGLVKSIAYYYGPQHVRSNAVLPGRVHSEMHTRSDRGGWAFERASLAKATMAPKAQADEIAAVVSWIGCDEASHVNGAVVTADGGWSAA
ncbi:MULTISPECIES: SDR family oxidoreductase [Pseudonocardia]|uniref:Pyridoxal 4-dehydrogenase n=2 Tax=Pseudonocardia TaxID=1847 RepID=A0A1Y2N044_PSEAH|nr:MULTISPECIES: SDR family oxidoreductase [Pseudonocardia]OSY40790.1 Pyridoxal 4-dehydrogenase [Pseudonocardia autotrophica]TDN71903.1 NAD(P)-dependent dehydrogenase (short-subunit alcohol dehydrogenase family) [Pseudonocardia autotrophica]BBG02591.1 short-chain dehydrogenase [Pseudonocardia autotrophica]GEC24650.1 short-chain dehydrogenase [Pseudonocardia saturnea]